MREQRTEIVKFEDSLHAVPPNQQLMKVNRWLLGIVFFLMVTVFVLGMVYVPEADVLSQYQRLGLAELRTSEVSPATSEDVDALKTQVVGLVGGSIEAKLKVLENSIKSGSVDNSLGTLTDLKNDIKLLRSYSGVPKKVETVVSNVQLVEEVSHLKRLIYATLASCGLMFVGAAGVWVKYRKRLPYKANKIGYLGKR
jgi:hypothetical protein